MLLHIQITQQICKFYEFENRNCPMKLFLQPNRNFFPSCVSMCVFIGLFVRNCCEYWWHQSRVILAAGTLVCIIFTLILMHLRTFIRVYIQIERYLWLGSELNCAVMRRFKLTRVEIIINYLLP